MNTTITKKIHSIILLSLFLLSQSCMPNIENYIVAEQLPNIDPDYTNIVIPPNIAPLNFVIKEEANSFYVKIYSETGDTIRIHNDQPTVIIPIDQWKELLNQNIDKKIYIETYTQNSDKEWKKYKTIENHIAKEGIDSHLAYRLINPGYVLWQNMGIYQRNIQNFDEEPIMDNNLSENNCMNCHSFCKNNPNKMVMHMRAANGGTYITIDGVVKKIDTNTPYTMSAGVYPAWHPNGNIIAFSVNKINQVFHSVPHKSIYVYDKASDLILYNIKTNTITTTPKISTQRNENLPNWSPDGKFLYFISGPKPDTIPYDSVKYDLMRISYDENTNKWGEVDTVLLASQTNMSITFPRISPDGKKLMFTMAEYGYFSIHFKSSDLYILDIKTLKYEKLDINSDDIDSFHSWSSNSRWFVFGSKRRDGLCTRPYFSYIDENGKIYKPFVLPQKDPQFYDSFLKNYNRPEMITGRVNIKPYDIAKAAHSKATKVKFDTDINIDALSGATYIQKNKKNKKNQ